MTSDAAWFERLAEQRGDRPLPTEDRFVLEVRISERDAAGTGTGTGGDGDGDGGGRQHVHHVRAGPEGFAYVPGPAAAADAWLTIDAGVADALRAGTVSITAAVQSGRIRVGGNLQALLAHQAVLAEIAERVAQPR